MAKMKSLGATLSVASNTVGGINTITLPESDVADIDLTTHDSTAREYAGGLADFGVVNVTGKFDPADTGQAYLSDSANQGGDPVACVVTFSDGSTASFSAVVKGFGVTVGDVDTPVEFSASLRISGDVTYAAGA